MHNIGSEMHFRQRPAYIDFKQQNVSFSKNQKTLNLKLAYTKLVLIKPFIYNFTNIKSAHFALLALRTLKYLSSNSLFDPQNS